MLDLKRWERVTHEETGVSFEVQRLNGIQVIPLRLILLEVMEPLLEVKAKADATTDEQTVAIRKAFDALPTDKVGALFAAHVRRVEGLTLDGEPATKGSDLFEVADEGLIMFALGHLQRVAGLTGEEGKALPSPSTSGSGPAGESSGSDAPSIGAEGGPSLSTATEIQGDSESSSRVA